MPRKSFFLIISDIEKNFYEIQTMIRTIFQIYYLVSIFQSWPLVWKVTLYRIGSFSNLYSHINFSLWENILENKPNLYNSTLQTNDQYWKTMENFFDQNIRKDILYELKYIIF